MARSPQESEQSLTDLVIAQPDSAELRGRLGLLYQSAGRQRLALADQLTGIDISANMIAKAEERGHYDTIVVAELHDYLQTIEPGCFDVIVACAKALDNNGLLAFSAEIGDNGFHLDHS
jgi:predicted TPR repeat methyltransferase